MERSEMTGKITMYGFLVGGGILFSLLFSCSHQAVQIALDPPKDKEISQAYLIGPEDVLEIVVWKNADLSKVVTVRPDGKISLPLIADVQAAGLTAVQLKEEIAEKLKAYQEIPEVSVIVQQINSYVVYILGEVLHPGKYAVKTGTTIIQGITLAGGFTPFASPNKILLLPKDGNNRESVVKIRYKDIISGRHLENNILLKPGDTIIVP